MICRRGCLLPWGDRDKGTEHQAIGPSSNGLRAPIAIRCYMRVDGDLQFTTSAVARAHHGG